MLRKLSCASCSNILLCVASIAVACLFAEGVLRLTVANGFVLFPRFHTAIQYGDYILRRPQPGIAFRDDHDYSYAKTPGVLRVLALGDSHTLGYEVRQRATYSEIIERQLAARGIKAEVLNTGVSGFSTAEQLAFLEQEGLRYNPDVVVLGFFRNDFEDNLKAGLFRLEGGRLVEAKMAYAPGVRVLHAINSIPGTAWLSQRSYLYSLGLNAGWNAGKRMLRDQALAALAMEYAIGTQELNGPMKALEVALIRRLHHATKARGIPLIIADVPTRNDEGGFLPSIPADILESFRADSEALVLSENVLGPYRGLTEFHVPHGNWHTNEFTHLMLGRAVANEVAGLVRSF